MMKQVSQGPLASILPAAWLLKPSLRCYQRVQTHGGHRLSVRFLHRSFLTSGSFNPAEIYQLQQVDQRHIWTSMIKTTHSPQHTRIAGS